METNSLVRLQDVSFNYGPETVLEHINLEVKSEDFLGIIGPNGSGKTTLLKLMIGLLRPSSGQVFLFDTPISKFKNWQNIGYVPQRAALVANRFPITVEEVVSMGTSSVSYQSAVTEALYEVDLENLRHKPLSELSGGQQQRVFIARALVSHPQLLILDEPTVGIDPESQTRFYQLLMDLNRHHHLTLVMVSHDIDAVSHEVKSIACINHSLVFHGPPQDILAKESLEKLYGSSVRVITHKSHHA